jgi:hypothetical protein
VSGAFDQQSGGQAQDCAQASLLVVRKIGAQNVVRRRSGGLDGGIIAAKGVVPSVI